jgi:hypothetical protein
MNKNQSHKAALFAGITGCTYNRQSKFDVAFDKTVRIALPEKYSDEHIDLAIKDCEILTDILKNHPSEIEDIVASLTTGKIKETQAIAAKIGIAEENFMRRGGGMLALILLAVACALLLEHD